MKMTSGDSTELQSLTDELIALVMDSGSYQSWTISAIHQASRWRELDTLRVYRNMMLREPFRHETLTLKYADYAMKTLRGLGHQDTASMLTPAVLSAFEAVAIERAGVIEHHEWSINDGYARILLILIERPEMESAFLHLIRGRKITDIDTLVGHVAGSIELPLEMTRGKL